MCQNTVLAVQNAIPDPVPTDVAARIAQQTLSRRGVDYAGEVRRLLDAALEVMQRSGTEKTPRVADIVATAGLSNEAFYRHFPSKDALVAALLEDGAERLRSYLAHQMAKSPDPAGQVRHWVRGVLSQADPSIAATTLAVLSNGGAAATGRHFASGPLATLLHEPLVALGSDRPEVDAAFVTHAVLGRLTDHLWARSRPTKQETDRIVELCLRVAGDGG